MVLKLILTCIVRLIYIVSILFGVIHLIYYGLYLLPIALIFIFPAVVAYMLDYRVERQMDKGKHIDIKVYVFFKLIILVFFIFFFDFLGINLIELITNKGNVFIS